MRNYTNLVFYGHNVLEFGLVVIRKQGAYMWSPCRNFGFIIILPRRVVSFKLNFRVYCIARR